MRARNLALLILFVALASIADLKAQSDPPKEEGDISQEFLDNAGLGELAKVPTFRRTDSAASSQSAKTEPEPTPAEVTRAAEATTAEVEGDAPESRQSYDELKEVAAKLEQWRKRLATAEKQVQVTAGQAQAAVSRLMAIRGRLVQAEAEAEAAEAATSAANQQLLDAQENVKRLEQQLDSRKNAHDSEMRRAEGERLAAAVQQALKDVSGVQSKLDEAKEELLEATASADVANQIVANTKERVWQLTREKVDASTEIAKKTDLIQRLTETRNALEKAADAFADSDVKSAVSDVQAVMEKKRQANEPLQEVLADKIAELADTNQRLEDAVHGAAERAEAVTSAQKLVQQLAAELKAAEKALSVARLAATDEGQASAAKSVAP